MKFQSNFPTAPCQRGRQVAGKLISRLPGRALFFKKRKKYEKCLSLCCEWEINYRQLRLFFFFRDKSALPILRISAVADFFSLAIYYSFHFQWNPCKKN